MCIFKEPPPGMFIVPDKDDITQVSGCGRYRYGGDFKSVISEYMLRIKFMSTFCEIAFRWMPRNTFDNKSASCSGNGLVPSGKKPLPEPELMQIYGAIWRH